MLSGLIYKHTLVSDLLSYQGIIKTIVYPFKTVRKHDGNYY